MRKIYFLFTFLLISIWLPAQYSYKTISNEATVQFEGYSSNGKYAVGTNVSTNLAVVYDFTTSTVTELPSTNEEANNKSKAYGITSDGKIIVGSFINPEYTGDGFDNNNNPIQVPLYIAGYYTNGAWVSLGIGNNANAPELDYQTDESCALATSDDGQTIVGYVYKNSYYYPCAWVYNNSSKEYEYVDYQLTDNNLDGRGMITSVSADGKTASGICWIASNKVVPVVWTSPDSPVIIGGETIAESNKGNNYRISPNGQYVVIPNYLSEGAYKAGIYNVKTGELSSFGFADNNNNLYLSSVSNNGIAAGYNYSVKGSITSPTILVKPYLYFAESEEAVPFYEYLSDVAPEIALTVIKNGFNPEDEKRIATLTAISADGKSFQGSDNGTITTSMLGGAQPSYETVYAINANPVSTLPYESNMEITDYSADGKYLVGNNPKTNLGFIYNSSTGEVTNINNNESAEYNETKVNAVNSDCSIMVGAFRNPEYTVEGREKPIYTAGIYRYGYWQGLELDTEDWNGEDYIGADAYGSYAEYVSEDGNVIAGYITNRKTGGKKYCVWLFDEELGKHVYTELELPENKDDYYPYLTITGMGTNEEGNAVIVGTYKGTIIVNYMGMGEMEMEEATISVYWNGPDYSPVALELPSKVTTSLPKISKNGKYITASTLSFETIAADSYLYNLENNSVETFFFKNPGNIMAMYDNVEAVSNEGLIIGNFSSTGSPNSSSKPYIYVSETQTSTDFYTYIKTLFPELADELTDRGFDTEESLNARLLGISIDGTRFIGLEKGTLDRTGYLSFENFFVLPVEEEPAPPTEKPGETITQNELLASEYDVTGYSSNGKYLVGRTMTGYAFMYDTEAKELTQISTLYNGTANGITDDGSLVLGTLTINEKSHAALFNVEEGEWTSLGFGPFNESEINSYYGSYGVAISPDGKIIAGNIIASDNGESLPTASRGIWKYNSSTGGYDWTTYEMPSIAYTTDVTDMSADGKTIVGYSQVRVERENDFGEMETVYMQIPVIWASKDAPQLLFSTSEIDNSKGLTAENISISPNGKHVAFSFTQTSTNYTAESSVGAIYDVESKELEKGIVFITAEDISGTNLDEVGAASVTAISNDRIIVGNTVVSYPGEVQGPIVIAESYAKPFVYHDFLRSIILGEYVAENAPELVSGTSALGFGLTDKVAAELIGITGNSETLIGRGGDPMVYFVISVPVPELEIPQNIETATSNITIYPNPTSDYITVTAEVIKATITNLNGQVVMETTLNPISVATLTDGVYFLKVETTEGIITQKVMVKR